MDQTSNATATLFFGKKMRALAILLLVATQFVVTDAFSDTVQGFPHVDVPDGKAVIYIYREKKFKGGGRSHQLFIDDTHVMNVKNNSCSYVIVDPGIVTFYFQAKISPFAVLGTALDRSVGSKHMIDFPVELGQEYFLQFKPNTSDAVKNSYGRLDLVPRYEAVEKSANCEFGESHEFG